MTIDVSTPAFEIAINGVKLTPGISALITAVEVTHESNSLDHVALTVLNLYPAFPFTHGRQQLDLGDAVTIKLGYVDYLHQVFDGEVTGLRPSFSSSEPSTISVEGHNRLHRLQARTRTRTFQGKTDKDIAETIARDNGLTPKAEMTSPPHTYVLQRNQTDLAFLLERAKKIRFEVVVDGRTLYFRKPADGGPAGLALSWGSGAPPLRALHHFEATLDVTKPVPAVQVNGADPTTGKPIKATSKAAPAAVRRGKTAAMIAKDVYASSSPTAVTGVPVATEEEAVSIAQAIFEERALRTLTGSGTALGNPQIRAGKILGLDGLGLQFSGNYFITRSTHRLDHRGYETTFALRRGETGS
jgi:phage protein D